MNTHKTPVHIVNTKGTDDRQMHGAALRAEMETALAKRQLSVSALARTAAVQRGDIYRWWRGESRPSRNSLARIALALDWDVVSFRTALGDANRATQAPDDLLGALRDQVVAITALVGEMRMARERDQDAAAAILKAAAALGSLAKPQGAGESTEQPALHETAGSGR